LQGEISELHGLFGRIEDELGCDIFLPQQVSPCASGNSSRSESIVRQSDLWNPSPDALLGSTA
jgi:hypothetical protein